MAQEITYDKGSEFMAEFATMIVEEYRIKREESLQEIHKPIQYLKGYIKLLLIR